MGNCDSSLKKRNTRESSQEETELPNRPHTEGHQRRGGGTQASSSLVPTSLHPPERETQTTQQKGKSKGEEPQLEGVLTKVDGADFAQYITVEDIKGKVIENKGGSHVTGHNFLVTVGVRNNTSQRLLFTSPPPIEWKEIIRTKEAGEENFTTKQQDQYEVKSASMTFVGWRMSWKQPIEPNERREMLIQDNPSLGDVEKNNRTISRSIDFDIGFKGSDKRVKATQNIEVVEGKRKSFGFDIH